MSNKGKWKFSASRAVLSRNMLRGNKVTIFLSYIYLYLYNLYLTNATYFGSNFWEKPTSSSTKMEQLSVTFLPIGKPRAVDNMASMLWGWHFKSSVCVCWAVIGNDATKICNVTIYKTLKWTQLTTIKLPLSNGTLIWLNIIGWVGGSLLRCNY